MVDVVGVAMLVALSAASQGVDLPMVALGLSFSAAGHVVFKAVPSIA